MSLKPVSAHGGLLKHWLITELVYLLGSDFRKVFNNMPFQKAFRESRQLRDKREGPLQEY